MTTTSNHGWDIPTVGGDEDVWGEILNDFFNDELDRQVTLEGLFSERPDATDANVKYYHATDRRIVYYNDGSSWEAVYGLGTDNNPVPGTSHFEAVSTEELRLGDRDVVTILDTEVQTTRDTTFDWTFSDIQQDYDLYVLECGFATGEDDEISRVDLTVSNYTDANYNYTLKDRSSLVDTDGATEWRLMDGRYSVGTVVLGDADTMTGVEGPVGTNTAAIRGSLISPNGTETLDGGDLAAGSPTPITQFDITSGTDNTAARVVLKGVLLA